MANTILNSDGTTASTVAAGAAVLLLPGQYLDVEGGGDDGDNVVAEDNPDNLVDTGADVETVAGHEPDAIET